MKKTALIIVIVICLILFFSTLAGGILLTVRTIGWQNLQDQVRFRERMADIFKDMQLPMFISGNKESFTIDDLLTSDLAGIEEIRITGISESITVAVGGDQVEARLHGTYVSWGTKLVWHCEKQGNRLAIYAEYPRLGLMWNDLAIDIRIPAEYARAVKINSVSGNCSVDSAEGLAWSSLQYNGVSGNLEISRASIATVKASSISGGIELRGCTGEVSSDSVSGRIHVVWDDFRGGTLKTVSGRILLEMPENAQASVSFTTVSGQFQNNGLPINLTSQLRRKIVGTINQGTYDLSANTVSGDLVLGVTGGQ
jgi:hypothetical protein